MSKKSDYFSDIILNDTGYYSICKKMVIKQDAMPKHKLGKRSKGLGLLLKLAATRLDYLEERCEDLYKNIN